LSQLEQAAIWVPSPVVRQATEADHSPDGYNIGVNIGVVAGQTVSRAHLHLMPDTTVTFLILAVQNRVRAWAKQKRIHTAGGWYFICAERWRRGFRREFWGGPICPFG
jgi:diadenosine tetraphosphate (Ap4A) HIT family hydrolase